MFNSLAKFFGKLIETLPTYWLAIKVNNFGLLVEIFSTVCTPEASSTEILVEGHDFTSSITDATISPSFL